MSEYMHELKFCMNCCQTLPQYIDVNYYNHPRCNPTCGAFIPVDKEHTPIIVARILASTSKNGVKLLDRLIKKIGDKD